MERHHQHHSDEGSEFARVERKLDRILTALKTQKELIKKLMSTQAEFDAQIAAANAALDTIAVAVSAEAKQVADFIAANPTVNTSALAGVVSRLEGVDDSINTVFEPPAEPLPVA